VIDLHSLSESNLLGYLSGAPMRLFAQRGGRSLDFLATVRTPWEDRDKHIVDRYLDALKPLGIDDAPRVPRLPTRHEDDEVVQRLLEERSAEEAWPLVGLFPGASTPLKRWPLEYFVDLAQRLEVRDGARIVLFLGPEESAMSAQVRAAAVGTPVLLLLGSVLRGAYWFAPVGEGNRVIAQPTLSQLKPADVYRVAHSMLRDPSDQRRQIKHTRDARTPRAVDDPLSAGSG
jgi:ADP-heptose:LPS heptosyltransferase